jgi:hypothetical protein
MRFFFACVILLSAAVAWGEAEKAEKVDPEKETNAKAAERAKALKADAANFVLDLRYVGEADKPYYSVVLSTSKLLGAANDQVNSVVQIDKAQAEKIVDRLSADGFLAAARDVKRADVAWTGLCYVLTVSGTQKPRGGSSLMPTG